MNDMSKYDPDQELDDLHRALEAGKKVQTPTHLQVEDLSHIANKHLSASARYDLSKKALQMTVQDNGRVYSPIYLATRVISGDEETAVKYLARVLNDLSRRGLIHSTLAPVSSLELALSSSVRQSAVFAFVHVPQDRHSEVQKMYPEFVMQEGDIGRELYDLSPILASGEFLTTISVGHCPIYEPKNIREIFQQELEQYLAVLPKGTRVRKVTQLAVTNLSVQFEVKFYNELLQDTKKVEIQYQRAISKVGEGLKQFNVLTGVKYFDANGSELYK